jgi:hypothetical protein
MKINVIALEGSGRNWVQSLLLKHPELEIWGESFPCFSFPERRYPTPPSGADALVVVVRDKSCQEASVYRRGFNTGYGEFEFSPDISRNEIGKVIKECRKTGVPVHFFDYEAALLYTNFYLDSFFKSLGVKPVLVDSDWRDANRKNFMLT